MSHRMRRRGVAEAKRKGFRLKKGRHCPESEGRSCLSSPEGWSLGSHPKWPNEQSSSFRRDGVFVAPRRRSFWHLWRELVRACESQESWSHLRRVGWVRSKRRRRGEIAQKRREGDRSLERRNGCYVHAACLPPCLPSRVPAFALCLPGGFVDWPGGVVKSRRPPFSPWRGLIG